MAELTCKDCIHCEVCHDRMWQMRLQFDDDLNETERCEIGGGFRNRHEFITKDLADVAIKAARLKAAQEIFAEIDKNLTELKDDDSGREFIAIDYLKYIKLKKKYTEDATE